MIKKIVQEQTLNEEDSLKPFNHEKGDEKDSSLYIKK